MKKFYVSAWFLLIAAVVAAGLANAFNPMTLVAFSLAALGLVFWLMLWSIVVNTRELKTE